MKAICAALSVAVLLSLAVIVSTMMNLNAQAEPNAKAEPIDAVPAAVDYYTLADQLNNAEIIDARDLTWEEIENRNGKLIIERVVGVVDNAQTGAGHVINVDDYYICYASVGGISDGDIVCTYFIYNPRTNYTDDIIARYDYIIDTDAIDQ